MKYKAGQEVFVTSLSDPDGFDYVLLKQDIIDMKTGEWDEAGLKIIRVINTPKPKYIEVYECFKFGLLPYWCYEKIKHYECSYWQHLLINLRYARWLMRNKQ